VYILFSGTCFSSFPCGFCSDSSLSGTCPAFFSESSSVIKLKPSGFTETIALGAAEIWFCARFWRSRRVSSSAMSEYEPDFINPLSLMTSSVFFKAEIAALFLRSRFSLSDMSFSSSSWVNFFSPSRKEATFSLAADLITGTCVISAENPFSS